MKPLLRQAGFSTRIRLICPSYPPVLGGTEIEAQRVCSALHKNGHQVKVLCVGGPPMPKAREWIDPAGVPVRSYGGWCPMGLRHYVYALGVACTLLLERRQYDVVYLVMGGVQLATVLPVARLLRKRVVMKFSGSNTIAPLLGSRLGRFELRLLRRWAGRILVLNPAMMEEAVAAGFAREQLGWMPNPVDIEQFRPARDARDALRRAQNLPAEAPVILFVGRLAPEKRLPSLLQAFAAVLQKQPRAILALVGGGPLYQELQELAATLGIAASIRFTGAVPVNTVCGWMQSADVLALVSALEGFPCALVEAMATGLAAVVSDIPANTQLIDDGIHGYVVSCGDSGAIAAAILRIFENPSLRTALGEAARNLVVSQYSTDKVTARYEQLFEEISRTAAEEKARHSAVSL